MSISNYESNVTERREGTLPQALNKNPGLTRPILERWRQSGRIWHRVVPDLKRNKYRVDLDEVAKLWASEKQPKAVNAASETADRPATPEQENRPASRNENSCESEYPDQPLGLPNGDRVPGGMVKLRANNPVKRAKRSMRRLTPRELLKVKHWIEGRLLRYQEHGLNSSEGHKQR